MSKIITIVWVSVFAIGVVSGLAPAPAHAEKVRYDDGPLMTTGEPFVVDGRKWPSPGTLDYSFINFTPDIPSIQVETAIANAFALWAAACPNLAFSTIADNLAPFDDTSATPPAAGDFRIQFGAGNHGDPYSFDGPGGVLAHAYFPPPNGDTAAGDAHFDEDESWTLTGASGTGPPFDLTTVATHEFGHALGLGHEPSADAIMNPFYSGPRVLSADDVAGIRVLYCPGATPSTLPLDIVLLLDVTGSMGDDLPNVHASIPAMLSAITTNFTDYRLGLATHQDFPTSPWGDPGDSPFTLVQPLGTPVATIQSSILSLTASGGADLPESQYNALNETLSQMDFLEPRLPVIFLLTDADFHDADVEVGYPVPGRAAVLAAISASGAKVFTLISRNPPDLNSVQGGLGEPAGFDVAQIEEEAQELADISGGGVFFVGTSSALFSQAIVAAIAIIRLDAFAPVVPSLSRGGFILLTVGLAAASLIVRRALRRRAT